MFPVLYEANELTFTSNGIGTLTECTSCVVTEERNGIYECEFTVLCSDKHYPDIDLGKIILVPHDDSKDLQPFVIYRASKPMDGAVTFNAHHVSYGLNNVILKPFTASGVSDVFDKLGTEALTANPFTYWTSKTTSGSFSVKVPTSARAILAGQEGSVLDIFGGGEYEFDRYTVKLRQNRGADNGVTIRYGKNLTNFEEESDASDIYDGVVPYWYEESTGTVVYGSVIRGTGRTGDMIIPYDMSTDFDTQPTAAQLNAAALAYLDGHAPWNPSNNIEVDFVALWQTDEYKDIAALERVKLCDTVTVYFPQIGASVTEQVISVEYDTLRERYSKIELGRPKASFAQTIVRLAENFTTAAIEQTTSDLEQAIDDATTLITGGSGGHVVIQRDADGKPQEILIMDTEDTLTAQNVLRINVNGIGFSSTGYSGTYTTAWTLDGGFVADFITSGYLSCNRIKGGILTLGGANNGDGQLKIFDGDGNETVHGSNAGFIFNSIFNNTETGWSGSYETEFPASVDATSANDAVIHDTEMFVEYRGGIPNDTYGDYKATNTVSSIRYELEEGDLSGDVRTPTRNRAARIGATGISFIDSSTAVFTAAANEVTIFGKGMKKLADYYPTQADMRGATAVYHGTGLATYIGLGVNVSQKRLFVYAGTSPSSLAYIGRVDLT